MKDRTKLPIKTSRPHRAQHPGVATPEIDSLPAGPETVDSAWEALSVPPRDIVGIGVTMQGHSESEAGTGKG